MYGGRCGRSCFGVLKYVVCIEDVIDDVFSI